MYGSDRLESDKLRRNLNFNYSIFIYILGLVTEILNKQIYNMYMVEYINVIK